MANPNPDTSGLTPFAKGQSGNPGGKSAEQRQNEIKAAEIAARLRLQMLQEMEEDGGKMIDRLDPQTLKLFKDSEDRGYGAPKQTIDVKQDVADMTDEQLLAELEEIRSRRGGAITPVGTLDDSA